MSDIVNPSDTYKVFKITSEVTVDQSSTYFFDYVHTLRSSIKANSSIDSIVPIKIQILFEFPVDDLKTLNVVERFSELLSEEVSNYSINGYDNEE